MRPILLLTLLIHYSNVFGQLGGPCSIMVPQDSTDWGIGVIKWERDKYLKGINQQSKVFIVEQFTIREDNSTAIQIEGADILHAGHYGNVFLKVFEIKNTSYKILSNTVEGGLWIDFNEINSKGLTFNTYYSILFNDNPNSVGSWRNAPGSLGVNLFKSCLNVRTEPSTNGKVVRCISRNINDIKFHRISIEYHKEAWAFITVNEYASDSGDVGEGCQYKLLNEFRGWAKLIDDKGYPNLWFSVTNY
jgi:hypothetical protein